MSPPFGSESVERQTPSRESVGRQTPSRESVERQTPSRESVERQTPSREVRTVTPGATPTHEPASLDVSGDGIMHLEPRAFRPFKTSEEYLYAMKEDLAEWLNTLYNGLNMTAESFMEVLETGVVLCEHANSMRRCADQFQTDHVERRGRRFSAGFRVPAWEVPYNRSARTGSFFARDNIHNFIRWCNELGVLDCLMFETEDLVSRKNEKHVILCLLEIARRGAKFGMAAPILVQFEQQIDREIAREQQIDREMAREQAGEEAEDAEDEQELEDEPEEPPMVYGPTQQVVTNDLKSLDEMVRDLVERCSCPSQFPMIRVSEGKYRIGDTKTLIFVRILRNHVMVRVGGGWDTLEHYLDKHDPCRCKSGHRTTIASRLFMKPGTHDGERQLSAVKFERHDGDGSDVGSSPALRTPISFRSSPALRRPSQLSAPDKRLYEEASGDSSSEVSDEGYRSQGHWKGAHSLKGADTMDRPESSLTHSSTESSDPSTEQPMSPTTPTTPTAPGWPEKPAKTRRSFIDSAQRMIKSLRPPKASLPPSAATPPPAPTRRLSTESLRRGGLQRSQSGGSEAGLRASVRSNRASEARLALCGKNTWSGGRQRERTALGAETFRAPPPNRATSASPGPRRRALPASPAPRRKHSHLLADLMDDTELDDDAKVLQKMEQLVRQYKPYLAQRQREAEGLSPPQSVSPTPPPRVTPRKESSAGTAKSRIPAPTFFQQSRSPTETCL